MTKDNPQEDQAMSNVRIIEEDKDPTDPGRAADPEPQETLVLRRQPLEPHDELTRDGFVVTIEDDGLPSIMNDILHQRERSWGGDFTTDLVTKYHGGPRQVIVVEPEPVQPPAEPEVLVADDATDEAMRTFLEVTEPEQKKKTRRWRKQKDT